jgi:hypothetical protein
MRTGYFINWHKVPGKNKTRLYAYLNEKITVPGGINSRTYCYLGKHPIPAIRQLYQDGKLSLEQVLSISDRKYPELAALKNELRRGATNETGNTSQAD